MAEVRAEVSRILISERSQQQFVVLREVTGSRVLPIAIGTYEALAINRFALGQVSERPLTHDLIANLIESLGYSVPKIVITDLKNEIFYARIYLKKNSAVQEIDARPSDAIAIATKLRSPIYINEQVFDKVLNQESQEEYKPPEFEKPEDEEDYGEDEPKDF